MNILDWIKNLFASDKRNAQLYLKDLTKTFGESDKLEVGLYDGTTPLANRSVTINVNGKDYQKITDSDGIARLNINLGVGEYTPLVSFADDEYKLVTAYSKITILPKPLATRMEGTDINMTVNDGTKYQCAVYDENNNRVKDSVNITVNGVTYNRQADNEGLYKLNINLNEGTYPIKAEYKGSNLYKPSYVNNTIKIKAKPVTPKKEEEKKQSYTLNRYMRTKGCSGMGQCTGYYCACNSVQQAIYRLTGKQISEYTLAQVGGTTTSGTGHEGINTMIYWFNKNYGYNLKIQWKNFSEVGYTKLQEYINKGAVFFHLLYRNQWGHYEVPVSVNGNNITVLNSLGSSCGGSTYCGYEETRTLATQSSYIAGISQKSLCIITRE